MERQPSKTSLVRQYESTFHVNFVISSLYFFSSGNIYCHTQGCERAVANTAHAAASVIGKKNRHGFILATNSSRKKFGRDFKKSDFTALRNQLKESANDDDWIY